MYKNDCRVAVLKSQSIEHYIIKALVESGVLSHNQLVKKYIDIQNGIRTNHKSKSYEKFCKNVLNGNKLRCVTNYDKNGEWYKGDCCLAKPRNNCKKLTHKQKMLILMWALPYCPEDVRYEYLRKQGFLNNTDITEEVIRCKEEFDKLDRSIERNG